MENDTKIYKSLSNLIKKKKYKIKEDAIDRVDAFFANDRFNSIQYNELINLINENYQEDSTPYPVDKINVLNAKLKFIKEYKWEISQNGFLYDGYIQSNKDRDVIKMRQCREGLSMGIVDSISWKLPNDTYKMIYDPNYFLKMELTSTLFTEKCFDIERIIQEELNQIEDVEGLVLYDEKVGFDELINIV